jgi:hypothetical protein
MEAFEVEASIAEGEEALQALLSFVQEKAGQLEAQEAEKGIFKRLMPLGLAAMRLYFAERGTGEVGRAVEREDGVVLVREGQLRARAYFSLFGKLEVPRTCYRTAGEAGIFPLDEQANLPERCYSYFLQEWMTLFAVEHPFKESAGWFEQLFDLELAESVLIDVAQEAPQDYDAFYTQEPPPVAETEGEILVVSVDGKGVPMIKAEAAKLQAKLGKGEKRQKKKEALVGVCYTVNRKTRSAEELAERLVDPEAARDRRQRAGQKDDAPKAQHVRRLASLARPKQTVLESLIDDATRRDPARQRPLAVLLDGALGLWSLVSKGFQGWANVTFVLDLLHVVGYLWIAANALFREGSEEGKQWVQAKLTQILRGRVGYVIGSLKQSLAKRKLRPSSREALGSVIRFLHNHRRWMKYDEYLAAGLPVATGVVESACGSVVKHRMEGDGKRWSLDGAEAILALRSLKKSHDNDLRKYWRFHAQQERARRYAQRPHYQPLAEEWRMAA